MKIFFVLFSFLFLLNTKSLYADTFNFDSSLEEWGTWGTGLGGHDPNIGHNKKGSLWLSSDWGEVQTVHFKWDKLKPGIYKITAFVRAQDVQAHPDGSSFWHFFDAGKGTENIFLSLHGDYEWRKIEYTIKVSKDNLSIWFRLKAPGQVWIDDFSIKPVSSSSRDISISPATALILQNSKIPNDKGLFSSIMLLDFDQASLPHPFTTIESQHGKKMGQFSSRKYYNFEPSSYLNGNWSKYDRIELDLFNGNKEFVEFYLTMGDDLSRNYWSQLNHKTHLAPGWNHLNFSLTQFLGERGSHRFLRSLNREKIKKVFIVIDPNEKFKTSSAYYIDNIKLTRNPAPNPSPGVYAFDFTSHKDTQDSGFIKVSSQHLYNKKRGFGFVDPKFWRVEDAQWTSNTLRYSIGLLSGNFKINLPNGKYRMQLVIDRLGYWDPSFWKDRTVYVNSRPVFKESRPYAKDFLNDLLQFQKIIPSLDDHPYDLYLKKIFKPQEISFVVTNGEVNLSFEGDPTGISLNSLIIWEVSSEIKAVDFLRAHEVRSKLEYDWMTRPIASKFQSSDANIQIATVIDSSLVLSPAHTNPQTAMEISFQGGLGEKPYQMIQIRGQGNIQWQINELRNKSGARIPADRFEFSELIPQYISPDLNHETYMLAGKYLKKMTVKEIDIENDISKYLFLSLNITSDLDPGLYEGNIIFTAGKKISNIPVQIRIMPYELPAVDFPVGFFGPDPIPFTYYKNSALEKMRKESRHEAIKILGQAGFTTFSGLPEIKLNTSESPWVLDTTSIDEMMTVANRSGMSKVYFSYGGKFPQQFFDNSLIPDGVSEADFFKKVSLLLHKYLNRTGMPQIIHTFSDEAGGYSDRVNQDLDLAKKIKSFFPFIQLGGFSSLGDPATAKLRAYFDYGLYSNISKGQVRALSTKRKWGSYNASPGNLDDPRYTFGAGLYFAQSLGMSHYLEWHSSSVNNFPYYDLDGRESDVTMFMPTSDGKLYPTLRFALAVEGLHAFRKLKLLKQAIKDGRGRVADRDLAEKWMASIKTGNWSLSNNILKPTVDFHFKDFHSALNKHLANLFVP